MYYCYARQCTWYGCCFFFLMIRRPPRSTQSRSSAASDVYKRQALERGLEDLKNALEERGYHTVFADEMNSYVSAYIYQEQNTLGQQNFHDSLNSSMMMNTASPNYGVLLIQAKDKTPDQIISMIENRVYSPLFYL